MIGKRIRPCVAVLAALVLAGCGKDPNLSGTYVEQEALGAPVIIRLEPNGAGTLTAQIGDGSVEQVVNWRPEEGDTYSMSYYDRNRLIGTEPFSYDDGALVFGDGAVRYARVEDGAAIPAGGNDVPLSFIQ